MSDIPPVNSSDGFTPYLIGFYVDTEHGWVGPYDKRAIESMIAAVRNKALHDAADEIERLRAELANTRKSAFLEAARFCDELRHPDGMEYETRDWLLGTELCADGLRNVAMKEEK